MTDVNVVTPVLLVAVRPLAVQTHDCACCALAWLMQAESAPIVASALFGAAEAAPGAATRTRVMAMSRLPASA